MGTAPFGNGTVPFFCFFLTIAGIIRKKLPGKDESARVHSDEAVMDEAVDERFQAG